MASDPELPQFSAASILRLEAGQSGIALPMRAGRICLPLQHLPKKVLHFVCELRESRNRSGSALSRGRTGGVFCPLQLLVFGAGLACLPVQAATEAEQNMVGAWEISNAARDKLCPVSFA